VKVSNEATKKEENRYNYPDPTGKYGIAAENMLGNYF
jgi:hypothetical protein